MGRNVLYIWLVKHTVSIVYEATALVTFLGEHTY